MKIKELPEDIRDIAISRYFSDDQYLRTSDDLPLEEELVTAFNWQNTNEGVEIWSDVDIGDFDSFREFYKCPTINQVVTNKYQVYIKGTPCDVYDVINAYGVCNPGIQHAIKKLLMPGKRGYKDKIHDLLDAKKSIVRAINLENE